MQIYPGKSLIAVLSGIKTLNGRFDTVFVDAYDATTNSNSDLDIRFSKIWEYEISVFWLFTDVFLCPQWAIFNKQRGEVCLTRAVPVEAAPLNQRWTNVLSDSPKV